MEGLYFPVKTNGQVMPLFVALLHDAGKPATTLVDPETGRTRSPRHSLGCDDAA